MKKSRRVKSLRDSGRDRVEDARRAVIEIKRERQAARKTSSAKKSSARKGAVARKTPKVTADRTATGRGLIRFRVDPVGVGEARERDSTATRRRIGF